MIFNVRVVEGRPELLVWDRGEQGGGKASVALKNEGHSDNDELPLRHVRRTTRQQTN